MSKKLKNLKWNTVPLEGFPSSVTSNLQGFVGLEECTTYGLDKEAKRPKKKKAQKKRENESIISENTVPSKKVKLSNGFIVESCNSLTPSLTNEDIAVSNKKKSKNNAHIKENGSVESLKSTKTTAKVKRKKNKPRIGEATDEVVSSLTPEDMLTWAEFKLPEPILNALAEQGFKQPTKIQQLTLPAAIHGRRDILGAAETGSGKTLAFGLPILTGILSLKAKAETKGLDVYEIPYKKTSNKKKKEEEKQPEDKRGNKRNKKLKGNKKSNINNESSKVKESSEEGYNTGEESDISGEEDRKKNNLNIQSKGEVTSIKSNQSKKALSESNSKTKKKNDEEEFLEEIEVPLRKRKVDSESDDSDDENYIHLSDILDDDDDDDDLASSSGEDSSSEENDNNGVDEESSGNEESGEENLQSEEHGDLEDSVESGSDLSGDEGETGVGKDMDDGSDGEIEEEIIEDGGGIGCVKVIDNIEMPGPTTTKTGQPLYALILTPTRELAIQISNHLKSAAKYTGIKIATIVGGMASVKQERLLRCGPEIVVATPGRLWQLVQQGLPHLQQMDCVKFLAIDETDRMIERGHFEELEPLLERLNVDETKRGARQNFVFSATLTMVHDLPAHMRGKKVTKHGKIINRKIEKMTSQQKIKRLVKMVGMTDPKVVDITTQNLGTAETLTESMIACSLEHKDSYLYYVLKQHPGRTIVFCNSIGCVKRLAQLFTILKCRPLPLHASMQQKQRLKNLERFRDDPHGVLIATDVAARGLDIPNVDHVIHYQVPRTAENYVHRSGRTARAAKEGLTILLMEPQEAYLYAKLCRTLNKTSELPTFPTSATVMSSLREIVNVARDIDALTLKRRRSTQALSWKEKVAREMDIIVDDDVVPVQQADPSIDRALKAKTKQLNALLSRPLFPKGFSFKYPTLNDPNALVQSDENALQVMKRAIETGELKKQKRKGKNAPLLSLEKTIKK